MLGCAAEGEFTQACIGACWEIVGISLGMINTLCCAAFGCVVHRCVRTGCSHWAVPPLGAFYTGARLGDDG